MFCEDCFESYLSDKEVLWNTKLELAAARDVSIISTALNIPFVLKIKEKYRDVCRTLSNDLKNFLTTLGVHICGEIEFDNTQGYVRLMMSDDDPILIKKFCLDFENRSKAGRVFDADVLTPQGIPVTRQAQGLSQRKCYICDLPARLCSAAGTHNQDEIVKEVDHLLGFG